MAHEEETGHYDDGVVRCMVQEYQHTLHKFPLPIDEMCTCSAYLCDIGQQS